jgi:hypothetical protein
LTSCTAGRTGIDGRQRIEPAGDEGEHGAIGELACPVAMAREDFGSDPERIAARWCRSRPLSVQRSEAADLLVGAPELGQGAVALHAPSYPNQIAPSSLMTMDIVSMARIV